MDLIHSEWPRILCFIQALTLSLRGFIYLQDIHYVSIYQEHKQISPIKEEKTYALGKIGILVITKQSAISFSIFTSGLWQGDSNYTGDEGPLSRVSTAVSSFPPHALHFNNKRRLLGWISQCKGILVPKLISLRDHLEIPTPKHSHVIQKATGPFRRKYLCGYGHYEKTADLMEKSSSPSANLLDLEISETIKCKLILVCIADYYIHGKMLPH